MTSLLELYTRDAGERLERRGRFRPSVPRAASFT
jgi:hypothetical protein